MLDLLEVRRFLRRRPPLSIDGMSCSPPWYLDSMGAPLIASDGMPSAAEEVTCVFGGKGHCWKLTAICAAKGASEPLDERDHRFRGALGADAYYRRLALTDWLIETLCHDDNEIYLAGFASLSMATIVTGAVESRIVAHMNDDHVDALVGYCRLKGIEASVTGDTPRMIGIDPDGFDVHVAGEILRIDFERPCESPQAVREALVALAVHARGVKY